MSKSYILQVLQHSCIFMYNQAKFTYFGSYGQELSSNCGYDWKMALCNLRKSLIGLITCKLNNTVMYNFYQYWLSREKPYFTYAGYQSERLCKKTEYFLLFKIMYINNCLPLTGNAMYLNFHSPHVWTDVHFKTKWLKHVTITNLYKSRWMWLSSR